MIKVFLFAQFIIVLCWYLCSKAHASAVDEEVARRLNRLKLIIDSAPTPSDCSKRPTIAVTDEGHKDLSNVLVTLTHGLWLSKAFNHTFVIPRWMADSLDAFDLSLIKSKYCVASDQPLGSANVELHSKPLHFLIHLLLNRNYPFVSEFSHALVEEASEHFLIVHACLWAHPGNNITATAVDLMKRTFEGLAFTSIHRMHGTCTQITASRSKQNDYPSAEISMKQEHWSIGEHPMCAMRLPFVRDIEALSNRTSLKNGLFVITDVHETNKAVENVSYSMEYGLGSNRHKDKSTAASIQRQQIAMFVSMNADFFILNPTSLLSWNIFLMRSLLGFDSVPVLLGRDIFFNPVPVGTDGLWVNWKSIIEASARLRQRIHTLL
jgi:hypothetical protein